MSGVVQKRFGCGKLLPAFYAALFLLGLSCMERPESPPSLPADPPLSEEKVPQLIETWTASNGQRRIVFQAEAIQIPDWYCWGSDGYQFRVTAEMHEHKETRQGERVMRLGGKANIRVCDSSGTELVHEAYSLVDLCPT